MNLNKGLKKILVIRFSSIGDIVLTTPLLRCLKKQLPDAELHYLTKKTFAELLLHNPYVSKVHPIDKEVEEVLPALKSESFDLIIDLHHNIRSAQVKMKLGKPSKSFRKLNIQKWLLVNFKINLMPRIHIVDRYMETVAQLGVKNDGQGLDFFIAPGDEVALTALPPAFAQGYTGFVIGAKHFTKQLPAEKIISICKKIKGPVLLLGGKEDAAKGDQIASAGGEQVYNACGKFRLGQSASLVKQARRIITHDTGLMHVAAAFKKEIISVWGSTVPEFGMVPYLGETGKIVEVKDLSCRPCSKIGYEKCPKGHFKCMNNIDESLFAEDRL